LRAALRKIGLRPTLMTILQMGGTPQVASSLIAGKVDAVSPATPRAAYPPGENETASRRQREEMKILSSGALLITSRRYINRERRGVAFMRAYVEGVYYFKTNKKVLYALQKLLRGRRRPEIALLTTTSAMGWIRCGSQ
jgi:hypothetical protein